jgi:hypothetical protein
MPIQGMGIFKSLTTFCEHEDINEIGKHSISKIIINNLEKMDRSNSISPY